MKKNPDERDALINPDADFDGLRTRSHKKNHQRVRSPYYNGDYENQKN